MTSDEFYALRDWIDRRTDLKFQINRAPNDQTNRQARENEIAEIDAEAFEKLVAIRYD